MVDKVFLYCSQTASKEIVNAMVNRHYTIAKLTNTPDAFFNALKIVDEGGVFALLSHGDANGPLMIAGTGSEDTSDADLNTMCERLRDFKIKFYCLSCNTGRSPFVDKLNA